MKRFLAFVALAFLAPSLMSADLSPGHFEYTNDGFSITLPLGWGEVPSDGSHSLRFAAEERVGVFMAGNVHIYQIEGQTNLAPAFALVRIHEGRVPDFAMRSLLGTNNTRANLTEFLRTEEISPNNVRSVSFDTNRFVIQTDAVHESRFGRHRALTKIFFTEDGTITISAVSTELDYSQWWATLGQIVDSLSVPERLRYRVRPLPNLSSGSRDWIIFGGAIVGVVLLATWVHRNNTRGGSSLDY